ncbi:uncharacterized protein C8Q71DRAFT_708430, partial [Rhodofomes roseus]
ALVFRFEVFGQPVRNLKNFEEGVFSGLLKPGMDACLEEPKVSTVSVSMRQAPPQHRPQDDHKVVRLLRASRNRLARLVCLGQAKNAAPASALKASLSNTDTRSLTPHKRAS